MRNCAGVSVLFDAGVVVLNGAVVLVALVALVALNGAVVLVALVALVTLGLAGIVMGGVVTKGAAGVVVVEVVAARVVVVEVVAARVVVVEVVAARVVVVDVVGAGVVVVDVVGAGVVVVEVVTAGVALTQTDMPIALGCAALGHAKHAVEAGKGEYCLAPHILHVVAPEKFDIKPAWHAWHNIPLLFRLRS